MLRKLRAVFTSFEAFDTNKPPVSSIPSAVN